MGTILLVEDDETFAYTITRQFEIAGYQVIPVNSTMSALTVLDSGRHIDLLVTDVAMPEGQPNGVALGRMAKIKLIGIEVILIAGYDLGVDDKSLPGKPFRKPVDFQSLVTEIGAQLAVT
jgi:CheY-like chemotaxis protein